MMRVHLLFGLFGILAATTAAPAWAEPPDIVRAPPARARAAALAPSPRLQEVSATLIRGLRRARTERDGARTRCLDGLVSRALALERLAAREAQSSAESRHRVAQYERIAVRLRTAGWRCASSRPGLTLVAPGHTRVIHRAPPLPPVAPWPRDPTR